MQMNQVDNLYPDNFGNFLLAKALGLSVAATGDILTAGMGIPYAQVRIRRIAIVIPPAAAGGINTGALNIGFWDTAAQGGVNLVANANFASLNAANTYQEATLAAAANTTVITTGKIFPNVGTSVAAGLIDVYVYGDVIGARA